MSSAPAHATPSAKKACEAAVQGPGQRLDADLRQRFETDLGVDLSGVRVHTGPAARWTAGLVGARAFAVGDDIAFSAGGFAPRETRGRRLLAHELVHVAQQRLGGPGIASPASGRHEREADYLGADLAAGLPVQVQEGAAAGPAFALEDYMNANSSGDINHLTLSQIQQDIDEIVEYLDRQIESNETTLGLEVALEMLRTRKRELLRNAAQEPERPRPRRGRGRRRGRRWEEPAEATPLDVSEMPRILRERTSLGLNDPTEVRQEVDRIVAWLQRRDVSREDRQILRDELAVLAPQRDQARQQERAARSAQRLQQVFATSGDATEQLRQHVGVVESIYTDPGEPGVAFIFHRGERLRISAERAAELRRTTIHELNRAVNRSEINASSAITGYNAQREINEDSPVVSTIAGWLGDVDDPGMSLQLTKTVVDGFITQARARLQRGDFSGAVMPIAEAAVNAQKMERAVYMWRTGLIEGASMATTALIFVRDASFAIATAIAAVVAAPFVAGAVAATGATGLGASALTVAGSGVLVGTGAGVAGGGAEYVGQRAAGEGHEEAMEAAIEQGERRAIEGASAAVGGSGTRVAGQALRVGGQASNQLLRRAGAEVIGNTAGSFTGNVLRGQDLDEAALGAVRQGVIGAPATFAGGLARTELGRDLIEHGVDTAVTTADTLYQGGSAEDVWMNVTVSTASRLGMSGGPRRQAEIQGYERRGAEFSNNVQLRARNTVAAVMIGTSNPATQPGYGSAPSQAISQRTNIVDLAQTQEVGGVLTQPGTDLASRGQPSARAQAGNSASAGRASQQAQNTASQTVIESRGSRATQRGIAAHADAIAEQERMGFIEPGSHRGATASARTARSITTGVRADVGEIMTYNSRLQRGEIGVLAPVGSNIPGPDSATAVRLPNGDYEIVVVDTKSRVSDRSQFGRVRSSLPTSWSDAVEAALAPGTLDLGNPAVENALRQAWAAGRVRVARDTVDFSPNGGGTTRLDN